MQLESPRGGAQGAFLTCFLGQFESFFGAVPSCNLLWIISLFSSPLNTHKRTQTFSLLPMMVLYARVSSSQQEKMCKKARQAPCITDLAKRGSDYPPTRRLLWADGTTALQGTIQSRGRSYRGGEGGGERGCALWFLPKEKEKGRSVTNFVLRRIGAQGLAVRMCKK